LAYLAPSLRKRGFASRILDCAVHFYSLDAFTIEELKRWLRQQLVKLSPKLAIGIGPCTTSAIRSTVAIADTCREVYPETPLLFGGPLALIPDQGWLFFERLNGCALVRGDGEYTLGSILARLREGKGLSNIPGVQSSADQQMKPSFIENLDSLPYPTSDMYGTSAYKPSVRRDLFAYPGATMVGSRGCPHSCAFCVAGQLIKFRRHSFEYVAEQVKMLRKNHRIRSVIFYDDSLFPDLLNVNDEITLFADLLFQSAPDVVWQIEIRPDVFSQIPKDSFVHLFSRGCRQLNIGIEKGSPSQLKLLSKPFDIDQLRETCQLVNRVCPKMRLTGTFILGGPGETLGSIRETVRFSTQLNLLFAHYYPLELYAGTPLYNSVFGRDNSAWFKEIMGNRWPWGEILYENHDISADQLVKLVCNAYHYFYDRLEWKDIAKRHLGRNYDKFQTIIRSWQEDRFQLARGT